MYGGGLYDEKDLHGKSPHMLYVIVALMEKIDFSTELKDVLLSRL